MAIELNEEPVSARTLKRGDGSFTMAAGKTLKIETSPAGEELLEVEVPEGKQWSVSIFVSVVETDA